MSKSDPYSVLGVSRDASNEQVNANYAFLRCANNPAMFRDPETRDEAIATLGRIEEAYSAIIAERRSRDEPSNTAATRSPSRPTGIEIPVKPGSDRKVVFADSAIFYDGARLAYADVVGITFYSGYSKGRIFDRSAGILILRSRSTRLKISIRNFGFWGLNDSMTNNYSAICREVMRRIGPPLLERLVGEILAGGTIQIGQLAVDLIGITATGIFGARRRATWDLSPEIRSTIKDHWYVAMTESGVLEVSYFHPPTGKMITVGTATSRDENGCLLSALLSVMTALHRARNR